MSTKHAPSVLIVDDTPENLTVLRDMLSRAGYRVRPVLQGELALRSARTDPPDLILLDVLMPGLSGYETCEQLKADPVTRHCPVLFISALDSTADKVRGFQVGALDFITKPFREEEVLARVRTHLALRQAQQQLQEQNEELAAAAALRDDVDRILRHDLRGPLANIIAFSELIADDVNLSHPALAERARVVVSAAYSALNMVHGSFDLMKMERGTYEARSEPFDLLEVLSQILQEMALAAGQKGVACVVRPAGDGAVRFLVVGERLLTRSLFYNLIRNALEASPPGGVLEVSVHAGEDDRTVHARIRNAGEVPMAVRARFFDKYVTEGKLGGTGLGTYSARLMAQAQGGSIELDAHEAGHTTVLVILPGSLHRLLESAVPGAESLRGANASAWPAEDMALGTGRAMVLIADDDPANRTYLAHRLPPGFAAQTCSNGAQALTVLCSKPVDLAVLDLEMPGLTGLEVVRAYRDWCASQVPVPRRARLVALTGHDDEATTRRCLEAGFDQVLTKPPSKPSLAALWALVAAPAPVVVVIDSELAPLIPDYLSTRPGEMDRLRQAIDQADPLAIASLAHRMRGSFAMHGFEQASQLVASIEALGPGQTAQALQLLRCLAQHLAELEIRYV